jgi:hypothetical protein
MGRRERTMILERAAAYVLAVVCILQAVCPSRTIRPQYWRSIDLRIGRLRMQARNGADSVCFERPPAGACSPERPISLLRVRQRDLTKLRICMSESGCMTAWLDETSHGWSISKGIEDGFAKSVIDLGGHETSAWGD